MKKYEFRYIVSFEDTNLVGNVYFANFIRWQGKCREAFIRERAANILTQIVEDGLSLVTLSCSCHFLSELKAFDEVIIAMSLDGIQNNRISMNFEYYQLNPSSRRLVAKGTHEIGCYSRQKAGLQPAPIPYSLLTALEEYKAII